MPMESRPCSSMASHAFSRMRGTSTPSRAICSPRSTANVGREEGCAALNDCPGLKLEIEGRGEMTGRPAW